MVQSKSVSSLLIKLLSFKLLFKLKYFLAIIFQWLFSFTYCFVTKKSLNIPYRKLSLNCKQYSKIIKCLFSKVLLSNNGFQSKYFILQGYDKTLLYQKNIKKIQSQKNNNNCCLQMFHKIYVLEYFVKFIGKQLCWSHFLIKLQA